jgi:hypothetical protein
MALYTDSDHVTAAELRAIDYEVADVAEVHKLTLEGVGSICRGAWEECADRLLAQFQHYGSGCWPYDVNTLPDYGVTGNTRAAIALSQVVVSDELAEKNSPLENWMIYVALEGLYRAVANASQEDRYKKKQDAYAREAASAWRTLWRTGLPVVSQPVPCPGAIHERGAGAFRDTDVSSVASGTRDSQPVEVAITWWDAVRQVESGPSRVVGYQIDANALLRVSRAGCLPPVAATHWNVYVSSLTGQPLTRQAQVAIATTSWTASGAIADTSTPFGTGQRAERRMAFTNFLQRS